MLDKQFTKSGSLLATLSGVTERFRVILGVPNIVRAQHDNPKGNLKLKDPKLEYPMGWWKATSMQYAADHDTSRPKNIGRFGSGWKVQTQGGATNAVVMQNYYFPFLIDATLTLRFLTEEQALAVLQRAIIASATEMMTFNVQMPSTKFNVRVLLSGNQTQFPDVAALEDGSSDKGIIEMELSYQIFTKVGFNMETAKINNLGEVTVRTSVDGEEDYVREDTLSQP